MDFFVLHSILCSYTIVLVSVKSDSLNGGHEYVYNASSSDLPMVSDPAHRVASDRREVLTYRWLAYGHHLGFLDEIFPGW